MTVVVCETVIEGDLIMTKSVIGELTALVKDFQVKRLPEDHEKMVKMEIAGRQMLYE